MMKKAIFTVYLGGYDNEPRPHKFSSWDNVIITDTPVTKKGWEKIIEVDPTETPDVESRRYKWLSHKYLSEYNLVCYHDANIRLKKAPPPHGFRIKHRKRSTIKEEADACNAQLHRCTAESINDEYDFIMSQGFPDNVGLFLNGFWCREHNDNENRVCEQVFEIIERFTPRDQIAFPYVVWKNNYKPHTLFDYRFYVRMVNIIPHKISKPKIHGEIKTVERRLVNVHHITPGRSDKNLGKAINDIVKLLPDDDWVCLRDIDTMPMYHEMFFKQCEDIANSGEFDLVGCMTNRLGLVYQLYKGIKSNEKDILHHRQIAKELYDLYGSSVIEIKNSIGGLFMLFSKKTWEKAGGFMEGEIFMKGSFIDFHFSMAINKKSMRIGIAQGIYLFHLYRLEHGDNTRSKEAKQHLLK